MFGLVKAIITGFDIKSSKAKARLLFLPVVLPFVAYFIQAGFYQQCITAVNHSFQMLNAFNVWVCKISTVIAGWLGPFIGLFTLVVIAKLIISWSSCRSLINKFGYVETDDYPDLDAIITEICDKAGIRKPRLIITNDDFAKSFTFGFRKPVIVLSKVVVEKMEPQELEAILAHELAHIIRKDTPVNLVGNLMRDLLIFAPPVFIAYNFFSEEKEKAADDLALKLTGNPLALAGALIKMWRLMPKSIFAQLSLYPSFIRKNGALEARIRRLMDGVADDGDRGSIYGLALLACSMVILILALVC